MGAVALKPEDLPHYTYDDYVQWEGGWELIQGVPYAMVPAPVINHQRLSKKIVLQLDELLDNCGQCEALLPVDWAIVDDTVVRPDVLVVCGEDIGEVKLEKTPVMVFEVLSPSTERKDRGLKYRLYEQAGVTYYCIVDPKTNSAEVYVLQKERYRQEGEFKEGRMLFDLGPCQIEFNFGKIF
ncbi:MAG: Uma2 family endonuclease [bacterium]|nr:Uma2 family endonuclease [bacterium]